MSKQKIVKTKFDEGYNCAQSVLTPFASQMNIDVETALKLSSGFGAGMGRTQKTCGALTGAYMVLGLKYGKGFPDDESREKVVGLIQYLTEKFKEEHEFTDCSDLLKVDLKTEEGQHTFEKNKLHEIVCSHCLNSAVSILEEMMKEDR